MNALFDKENINHGRQIELDIARGLAVLFMIAVHVLQVFANEQVMGSFYGTVVGFWGGSPAAPVFMFLLGVGIVYSTKSEPHILLKRGLIIFLAGYALNILRGSVPNLIGYALMNSHDLLEDSVRQLTTVDILQFAGLTLIYFSAIRKVKDSVGVMLITGVLFCAFNFLLLSIETDNLLFSALSGLVWGSNELSYFPFLSWILYPIAGYCFGTFLLRCADKPKFYLVMLILGSALFLGFWVVIVYLLNMDIGFIDVYAYYHHTIFGGLIFLSFTVFWISLLFFISKGFVGVMKTTVERWSRNVASIYFIHWVLVGNLTLLLGLNTSNLTTTITMTGIIAILSDMLALVYGKISKRKAQGVGVR